MAARPASPAGNSLRRSLAAGVGRWLLEVTGGTLDFLWPNLARGFGGVVTLGNFDTIAANPAVPGATLEDGAPA